MSAQSNAPIIIKRKKVVAGGGHHGGAWKVAIVHFLDQTTLLRRCGYARSIGCDGGPGCLLTATGLLFSEPRATRQWVQGRP